MSFHDSDWTAQAESTAAAQPGRTSPYVAGAIGLAIGIAIGATAVFWALQGRAAPSATAVSAKAALAPRPAASAAPIAATPASKVAVPAIVADEPPTLPEPPSAGASKPLSAVEVARRKERAWDRFYHRPAICDGNPSADQLVECGNHYIRHRREFEERWRTGTL